MVIDIKEKLAETHVHLGASVDPATMWEIAHSQGIKLPTKDYWEFVDLITVNPNNVKSLEDYTALFKWTELIQSSPLAVERAIYQTIAGAYRKNNITLLELRFNPMKRNRGGEQDLDQIIMAATRGLDRASMEYPIKSGIIICLDKNTFTYKQNEILVQKAIKYRERGVVGIDLADPIGPKFLYSDYKKLYKQAKDEGLGLTVHAGENEGSESVIESIINLEPDRIGHGIQSSESEEAMDMVKDNKITLEVCPTSNLHTRVVGSISHMKKIFNKLNSKGINYTINTDGPELLMTNLRNEMDFLITNNILTEEEILRSNRHAFKASFAK